MYLRLEVGFGLTLILKERIEFAGGEQCWSVAVTVNEYSTSDAEPIGGVQQNSYSFSLALGSTTLNVAPGIPAFHLPKTVSGVVWNGVNV